MWNLNIGETIIFMIVVWFMGGLIQTFIFWKLMR